MLGRGRGSNKSRGKSYKEESVIVTKDKVTQDEVLSKVSWDIDIVGSEDGVHNRSHNQEGSVKLGLENNSIEFAERTRVDDDLVNVDGADLHG